MFRLAKIASFLVFYSMPAAALVIQQIGSFDILPNNAAGVAFDPITGNVFVVQGDDGPNIFEYDTSGNLLGTIDTGRIDLNGLDILPNGNFLAAWNDSSDKRVIELDRTTGALVSGGIDFAFSFGKSSGVVLNPNTGTIFHADEVGVVRELDTAGVLLSTISMTAFGAVSTEGIAINPLNGNLIISDDFFADDNTRGALFEISLTGELVDRIPLVMFPGLQDPLGLTVDYTTNRLFIGQGFTPESRVDIFQLCSPFPGGGQTGGCFPGPGPFPGKGVPEPTTILLLGVGLAGLGFARRV